MDAAVAHAVDFIITDSVNSTAGGNVTSATLQIPPLAGSRGVSATIPPAPSRESILLNAMLALHENMATSSVNFNLELLTLSADYPDLASLILTRLQLLTSQWSLLVSETRLSASATA